MENIDRNVPFVSIIIPVRNEEKHIGECLSQLMNQTYPKDRIEIIIIDGESDDRTRDIVRDFQSNSLPIQLISNDKKSVYTALNLGIQAAKGDIIIRVDGRSVCPIDYVEKCVNTLIKTGADNVGGVQKPVGKTVTQKAIALAMSHPFGIGNAKFRLGKQSGYVDTVYLGCFMHEIFNKVGLFDEESGVISEDSDMNQRIRDAGGKVFLNHEIIVSYYPRDNIKDHWKIYFVWGLARAKFFLKHKKLTSVRQIVPPLFVLTLSILIIFSFLDKMFLIFFWGALGIYIVSACLISAHLSFREKHLQLFPLLVVVFACMHFAWGIGFIKGVLNSSNLRNYWR